MAKLLFNGKAVNFYDYCSKNWEEKSGKNVDDAYKNEGRAKC
jgi:hypothetical protein